MSRSPYTAGLKWEPGHLNDSSYAACTKFAGKVLNCHPPGALLKEIADLIEAAGDSPDKRKLSEQFRDAFAFVARERAAEALGSQHIEGSRSEGKWPAPDPALIATVYLEFADHTLAHWQAISPRRARTPRDVLPALFPGGELVCCGPHKNIHLPRAMDAMLLDEIAPSVQFIVCNPIREGFTIPPGKRSPKCDENFPLRRFVIMEFDRERIDPERKLAVSQLLDLQSALHAHLVKHWRWLTLLVHSGNESLHGWYPCEGLDEESVIAFLRYACRLGADHSFSSPSQFTRMPGGLHANGTRQSVHFFNPRP